MASAHRMDRRLFLRWLGGTAAGAALAPTLDLERLLWVPGAKRIVLPPVIVQPHRLTGEEFAALWERMRQHEYADIFRREVRL